MKIIRSASAVRRRRLAASPPGEPIHFRLDIVVQMSDREAEGRFWHGADRAGHDLGDRAS
jgi:hypothetical protein